MCHTVKELNLIEKSARAKMLIRCPDNAAADLLDHVPLFIALPCGLLKSDLRLTFA
jgi:hypothetical protein